jgi:D-galactose 1-dehydrogenase
MSKLPIRIGLVGVGKIARDQHIPVLRANPSFQIVAAASRNATLEGVTTHTSIEEMLAGGHDLDAVALCTPPQDRFATARAALAAGCHLLLEKPPGATLSEIEILVEMAGRAERTLFATWHSRFAPGVEAARTWLAANAPTRVKVDWREDVRQWHPGQEWIWEPGGMGVFDPGINALSIVSRILPKPFFLRAGTLNYPANRASPIAAELTFSDIDGLPILASFDWLQTGEQTWDIRVETDDGVLLLSKGGSVLTINDETVVEAPEREYANIYERFAELIASGASDVDVSPLRHVADAYLRAERRVVEPFHD